MEVYLVRTIVTLSVASVVLATLALWLRRTPENGRQPTESESSGDTAGFPTPADQPPDPPSDRPPSLPRATSPRTEPSILAAITRQALPDVEVPLWADEMEGAILSHISQQQGLELTDLQVQCSVSECVIFMGGRSIPVYQMGFDVFATDNGFSSATIRTMDGGPNRIVYLRR
jgi:hypothetical protein